MKTITLKSSADSTVYKNIHDDNSASITKEFSTEEQCRREAQFISKLDCAIKFTSCESNNLHFPFLTSLESKLNTPLEETRACKIMLQLCTILQELRDKKIIHRDIKPSNLFFDAQKKILLNDFETALQESTETPKTTCGTPTYMPPEQFSNPKVTFRVDQYAAGIVFFQMLCGTVPCIESDVKKLYILKQEKYNPADINPKLSRTSNYICSTMIHPNPDQRFNSITEITILLQEAISSLNQKKHILEAPSVTIAATPRKNKKKLPFLYVGMTALAIYLLYRLSFQS